MSADFTGAYIECLNTISQQGKRIAELESERDNYQRQFHDMHTRHMADKERIAELEALQIPPGWVAVPMEPPPELTPRLSRDMTLREHIAAQVLAGIGTWCPGNRNPTEDAALIERARWAARQADALIAALDKGVGNEY